ncbi:MAG: SulP family inorganic anion transporter [Rhodospirillaceae bacterium]|nr:SulP family inorganic anion transporter [Rhodospirillaceae bacterium]
MPARLRRFLPPPLAALIVGTLLALVVLQGAPVIGLIPRGIPIPHWPTFDLTLLGDMIQSALVLALLGSIDSLLTSLIADNVTRTQHDSDRELLGQGIGNVVAGLFGGIPGAGATMRTVVNVRAGGRTPISGALHALVLLALVLGLAPLAEGIPLAVLAGILLKVGWDIIDWDFLRRLRRAPRGDVLVMATVLLLTVFTDLVTAVGVGIIMASLLSARQLSEIQLSQLSIVSSHNLDGTPLDDEERAIAERVGGRLLILHLSGPFSFGSARDMISPMAVHGDSYGFVVYDLSDVSMLDTTTTMALDSLVCQARDDGRRVIVVDHGKVAAQLDDLKVLDHVDGKDRFDNRLTALRHIDRLVTEDEAHQNHHRAGQDDAAG